MKSKKRITLLAVLVCLFALVLSLGIFSACGNADGETAAGGSYLYGTTAPAEDLGNAGDYYLDTESLKAYVKTAEGGWVPTALYSGAGKPADGEGKQGDLYLDTTGGVLYQKGESLWSIVLKVKGRDGVVWFSGKGDPNDAPAETLQGAMAGDFYLNTVETEFTVWQLGVDGKWTCLGSIKGTDGKNGVHVFYGTGAPDDNKEVWQEDVGEGDLYFSVSDGLDGTGAGTVLYRYTAEGTWEELMREEAQEGQINIRTLEQLFKFAKSVNSGTDYTGKQVHLKADIDLSKELAKVSVFETIENTWTPIGTSEKPFKGTFDGEGHTISNLKAQGASAGLFGVTENATIQNVTLAGATVTAEEGGNAGILVAEAKGNLKLSGIKVENSVIKTGESTKDAKVGALVGSATGEVTVEDINVQLAEADTELEDQSQKNHPLIGSGTAKYEGENELDFKPAEGFVEKIVIKGDGTQETPTYEISSANGLKYFAKTVNGADEENLKLTAKDYANLTVKLVNDIDLTNEEWTPIGGTVWETEQRDGKDVSVCKNPFQGTFDGRWHKISNLKIDSSSSNYVGLFGYTDEAAVRGFTIENVDLNGQQYVGAVVGSIKNGSTSAGFAVSGVAVKGKITIKGKKFVGGITGSNYGIIKDCWVIGSGDSRIEATYSSFNVGGDNAGGITGFIGEGGADVVETIKYCYVSGLTVSGTRDVGGIAGSLFYGKGIVGCAFVNGTVERNNTAGNPTSVSSKNAIGGIVGQAYYSEGAKTSPQSIKDNRVSNVSLKVGEYDWTYETTVKNDVKLTNAILGYVRYSSTLKAGTISAELLDYAKNYIEATGNTVENVRYHGILNDVAYGIYSGKAYVSSATVYTTEDLVNVGELQKGNKFGRGDVSKGGVPANYPTTINFAENTTFDFDGAEFAPLSGANFNFDGHGSTITNVKFGKTDVNGWSGFVGWFGNGTIRNLTIKNATASGSQAGIFVGHCDEHTHLENVNLGGEITVTYEGNAQETCPGIGAFTGMLVGSPTITGAKVLADAVVTLNFGTEFNPNEASEFIDFLVGYGTDATFDKAGMPTKEEGAKIVLGGKIHVKNGAEFLAVLGSLQTYRDCLSGAEGSGFTLALAAGNFDATADNQFRVENDGIHIEGAGDTTILDAKTFSCSGQAGFEFAGDHCSLKNVKLISSSTDGNVSALKVTDLNSASNMEGDFVLENVTIEGSAGHALNLHGVHGVKVDNVTITKYGKCGISFAQATGVTLSNVTISGGAEGKWASIGFMYNHNNPEDPAYLTPSDVTVNFATCTFDEKGTRGVIYSERPTSAGGADVIRNTDDVAKEGTVVNDGDKVNTSSGQLEMQFVGAADGSFFHWNEWNMNIVAEA